MSERKIIEYVPKVKKYTPSVKSIKIIGLPSDVIEFETVEDFNKYYSEHTDDFNEPTLKLNKKYKIRGYTLTKHKNENGETETCLKVSNKNKNDIIIDLQNKYKQMAEAFNQLSEELQAVVKHLTTLEDTSMKFV